MKPTTRRWVAILLSPFLLLTVLSTAYVAVHTAQNSAISPVDEYVYFDYLSKVPTQGFVRTGEETGEQARQEIACRGIANYGAFGNTCAVPGFSQDALFPYNGQTGADIYTPAYFAVTWVLAQPLTWVGVSLFDAGRLVGAVWLSLGTCLTFALLRGLRTPKPIALAITMLTLATPVVFWAHTYISTDAPSLAIISGLGLAAVAVMRKKLNPFWMPLFAIIAVVFKLQNIAAVGIAVLVMVVLRFLEAWRSSTEATGTRRGLWRLFFRDPIVWSSVLSVVLALMAQVSWLVFRASQALDVTPPIIDNVQLQPNLPGILDQVFVFVRAIGSSNGSVDLIGAIAANILSAICLAAVVAIIVKANRTSPTAVVIASSTLLVALLMGPLLATATYVTTGYYVPLPARYGLSLLPAFLVCAGLFLTDLGKRGSTVAVVIGAACAITAIAT